MQKYIYELSAEPRLLDVAGLMLEYQYAVSRRRAVVNLSRRQTLIKIFTKYLLGANSNIQHTTQHGPTYNTGVIRDSWKVIFEKFSQSWKRPLLGPSTAFTSNLLILPKEAPST